MRWGVRMNLWQWTELANERWEVVDGAGRMEAEVSDITVSLHAPWFVERTLIFLLEKRYVEA